MKNICKATYEIIRHICFETEGPKNTKMVSLFPIIDKNAGEPRLSFETRLSNSLSGNGILEPIEAFNLSMDLEPAGEFAYDIFCETIAIDGDGHFEEDADFHAMCGALKCAIVARDSETFLGILERLDGMCIRDTDELTLDIVKRDTVWIVKLGSGRLTGSYEFCKKLFDADENARDLDVAGKQPEHLQPFYDAYHEAFEKHGWMTIDEFWNDYWTKEA